MNACKMWAVFAALYLPMFCRAAVPNVVFILADDLGWNDVGYHNPTVISPRIDELARSGVILDSAYSLPVCTPTRSALLTGRYPFTIGMQHNVIAVGATYCLPLNLTLLPQELKQAGYATHMVGKWHQGHCNLNCTPTKRGFDSFYGLLNAGEDHYTKDANNVGRLPYPGPAYDFWNNSDIFYDNVTYSSTLYGEKARQIIRAHDTNRPLFLYLAPTVPHGPLQVPAKYANMYSGINDTGRKTYLGMVTALDEFVGSVVDQLKASGLYHNTILIFSSDNGGQSLSISGPPEHSGNNYPLRGTKGSLFEGGTRVASFVHSPLLKHRGVTIKGLMHMTDWYPTILEFAGLEHDQSIDGVSQYNSIMNHAKSPRKEMIYNIDYISGNLPLSGPLSSSIRVGNYKLILGSGGSLIPGIGNYFTPSEFTGTAITGDSCTVLKGRNETIYACLFNLAQDPYEQVNLYQQKPELVRSMTAKLSKYIERFVQPWNPISAPYSSTVESGILKLGFC